MMNRKGINVKSECNERNGHGQCAGADSRKGKEKRPIMKRKLKHLKILVHIWLVRPLVQPSSYKISFVLNQNCINNLTMKTFSLFEK